MSGQLSDQLTELLTEVTEATAVFSESGWLLRLEGHIEDLAQITQLYADLTGIAATAGTAGQSDSNTAGPAGLHTAGATEGGQSKLDLAGISTAGTAGSQVQVQALPKPDWSDDSDALRGRLLELGGVAGLQTDTDCLLLKDLCRPGLDDNAFLDLIDLELQVCGRPAADKCYSASVHITISWGLDCAILCPTLYSLSSAILP